MPQRNTVSFAAVVGGGASKMGEVDGIVELKHKLECIVKNHGQLSVKLEFQTSAAKTGFTSRVLDPEDASHYITLPAKGERAVGCAIPAGDKYFQFLGTVVAATVLGVDEKSSEVEVEIREIVPVTSLTIR